MARTSQILLRDRYEQLRTREGMGVFEDSSSIRCFDLRLPVVVTPVIAWLFAYGVNLA